MGSHGPITQFATFMDRFMGITPSQGAVTAIYLATTPEFEEGDKGRYWDRFGWRWPPGWMKNDGLREEFWRRWERDVGFEEDGIEF